MAVEAPELLYSDYIEMPGERTRILHLKLVELQEKLRQVGAASSAGLALTTKLQQTEQQYARAIKIAQQRRELFDIMRNEVFGADKGARVAVERLRKRGADDAAIRAFQDRAARVSTPKQIAELEREAMR